jgi:PKD repeat protein
MDKKTRKDNPIFASCLLLSVCLLFVYSLFGCEGSSSTRSAAKDATSGTYEINAQITAPADGVTVQFINGSSDVSFSATATGGTEPYGFTWDIKGPTRNTSATGQTATITFLEEGDHTIILTVRDSNGITGTDSITITVKAG